MNIDLLKAKKLLSEKEYTCVLVNGDTEYHSFDRGVKPLLDFIDNNVNLNGFSAADKVVGKATAFLYVLTGVDCVYTPVISKGATAVLKQYNINFVYDNEVEYIINRRGDGYCPMESAVLNTENPQDAIRLIKEKLKEL